MNRVEFDATGFHADMWVIYQGERHYVVSVDFEERLFGLIDDKHDVPADEWKWVRCESVKLASDNISAKILKFPQIKR